MEDDMMEAWLDDHRDFTHSYFVRKASRDMVNAWFAERVHTIKSPASKDNQYSTDPVTRSLSGNQSPAASVVSNQPPGPPARKISASEFDRPLRPIVVTDEEGSVTFLSDADRKSVPTWGFAMLDSDAGGGSAKVASGCSNRGDRCTRLLELVKDVSSHLDVTALCHKIFLHINELIAADRYSLFLVGEDSSNTKFLVSRLFDVAEGSTLEESSSSSIRLQWNKGIVGHVAATGQPLNIKNAYEDPRFNAEVDMITGYKTHSILCLPIKNHRDEVVGVAQAINKKNDTDGAFTQQDEKDFSAYLAFSGIVLHNAQLYEASQLETRRNQVLLELASLIFEEQQCLEVLLRKFAGTILSFMQAQACTVFIAENDSTENPFSSVFHMEYEKGEVLTSPKRESPCINQINYMYAQYVKNTMQPLNIVDVTKDQRFPLMQCEKQYQTSKRTTSLLCAPIKNGKKDKVIGCCQLVNKMDEVSGGTKTFNRNDEQFLEAFAIFCGLAIQNTQMYETMERAMAKQQVTLEVLSYHASAAAEESRGLQNRLRDLEVLALMIATLCHDLDHRGVNNFYIQRSEHPLAQLYCHSTMEHHHFDQCLMILNSPGNQILSGLSLDEYKCTLKMIERAILSTDLALYIKRREEFFELTHNRQFVWETDHHRDLLRSMLMTACDISAITKPWPVQKRIAELVATEFFEQGDKERLELNIEPSDLMNREKRDKIPSMQVSFIDAICTQLYETLAGMSDDCSPLLEGCRTNRQHWKCLAEEYEKGLVNSLV
ncbi:cGMP-specific 3',5'-cyclic phosphodiesterase isoform X3 [Hippocampus zosterae]|uniref:cGMP-specific 3',5'-cyclic phosphodiesterase isoform X3 n=1 Tax=Hippocampus zosterae TaxID=109293 RepID=UPI00223D2A7D|nr:cGMP-specific 3',5'-cyclic phosphodiesterase isoform X3 [Hippocampus zosterae]